MGDIKLTAGTKLSISTETPEKLDLIYFLDLDFELLGSVTTMTEVGKEYNLSTYNRISDRKQVKKKGSFSLNAFSFEIVKGGFDLAKTKVEQGLNLYKDLSFKLVFEDGDYIFFVGKIMSKISILNDINNIVGYNIKVELTDFLSDMETQEGGILIYTSDVFETGVYKIYKL